jgi:hypothetical protein
MSKKMSKQTSWVKENRNLLILIGVVGVVLVCVWGYNWYQTLDYNSVSDFFIPDESYYHLVLTNVFCYENYVQVYLLNSGTFDITTEDIILKIYTNQVELIGSTSTFSPNIIPAGSGGWVNSTEFSLVQGNNYTLTISVHDFTQSIDCISSGTFDLDDNNE